MKATCLVEDVEAARDSCSCCGSGCGCLTANEWYNPWGSKHDLNLATSTFYDPKPGWPLSITGDTPAPTGSPTDAAAGAGRRLAAGTALTQAEAWRLPRPAAGVSKRQFFRDVVAPARARAEEAAADATDADTAADTAEEEGTNNGRALLSRRRLGEKPGAPGERRLKYKSKSKSKCKTYYYDCYYPVYHLTYPDPTFEHGGLVVDKEIEFCHPWMAEFVATYPGETLSCYYDSRDPSSARMDEPDPTGWMVMPVVVGIFEYRAALHNCTATRVRYSRKTLGNSLSRVLLRGSCLVVGQDDHRHAVLGPVRAHVPRGRPPRKVRGLPRQPRGQVQLPEDERARGGHGPAVHVAVQARSQAARRRRQDARTRVTRTPPFYLLGHLGLRPLLLADANDRSLPPFCSLPFNNNRCHEMGCYSPPAIGKFVDGTWVAPDGYCAMHQAGRAGEVPTATATAVVVGTPVLAQPQNARLAHITKMRDEGKMTQSAFDDAVRDIEMSGTRL